MAYLLVFLGAGIGGVPRQFVNLALPRITSSDFPFGTLAVNIVGSVVMGAIVACFALRAGLSPSLKIFLTTGTLGGFTTFSTFSLDSVSLWERGQTGGAVLYVAASLLFAIAGLVIGMTIVRLLAAHQ
ncbi:fluoride efflux transporter CrcB (plasmid) [Rhizobium sp. CC1099]|uniref:fluoride efflux transporter CrcB n=1 Tax=Rhizobium sp. CC1099 TaxID=3039160 RepID=UPI0024B1754D|nr:fluoride efflux transporter CrcB [Rhizobium sp. CC1099]WFU91375.1 fluoride efflux transporter CrcB [Rhizobium sp. CC1099]